ncbi:MAG TPA: DUF4097 family beta strand repeat-containing protein [Thermoanaerobaculia bacterium]|nr:DUF4097 family beta strand repeat-containing protein [Thermoanaerobaculia bacterium]
MRTLQTAALALSAALAVPALAGPPSKDVAKTLPLAAGEHVRVDTYKGSVRVTTWDRAEVAVEARVVADEGCGSAERQARWVDQTKVDIDRTPHGVAVTSDYDALDATHFWSGSCTSRPFVHYVIRMPKGAALKITDYKSDLDVRDLEADLSIETYKGNVAVAGLAGGLKVETYKGDVKAGIVRLAGDVRGQTYKGSIALTLPAAAAFELTADAGRKGSVESEFHAEGTTTARRGAVRVSGAVNGGGRRVSLRTDKGSLAVRKG